MLIDAGNLLIETASIRAIEPCEPLPGSTSGRSRVLYTDGHRATLTVPFERLSRRLGVIVPAPAGFSVVEAWKPADAEGGQPVFDTSPVIAFRVTGAAHAPVIPITPLGEPGDSDSYPVLVFPDGRCVNPWDRHFSSVKEFKAWFADKDNP